MRPDLRDGLGELGRPLRLVAVHAHPDDETLATGLTLAHHALAGDEVHVITATLGEEGEVITPELAHLEGSEHLADHRAAELARATAALGVRQHYLGGERPRWRDSGMAGSEAAAHPRAFAAAPVEEVAEVLAGELAQIDPDVVITYDPHGGYGHPDHIQTHRVTLAALRLLAGSASTSRSPRAYMVLTPRSWALEDRAWLAREVPPETTNPTGARIVIPAAEDPYPVGVVADELVTHAVIDPVALARQQAALRAHPTQVTLHDGFYALSNDIAARLPGREGFAEVDIP